jgi:hypothetical protein
VTNVLKLNPRKPGTYIKIDQTLYASLRRIFTQLRVAIVNAELQYQEERPERDGK